MYPLPRPDAEMVLHIPGALQGSENPARGAKCAGGS